MTKTYPWLPLSEISKYEPEMRRLGVSKVARNRGGFLYYYKQARGNPEYMSDFWKRKRAGFIARFLPMWRAFRTERVRLALIAWAYMPEGSVREKRKRARRIG